mgnify:CR=1 FL=1
MRPRRKSGLHNASGREALGRCQARSAATGRPNAKDNIGIATGKVINKYKVGKHFILDITDTAFTYRHDPDTIRTEADLDGIYIIRTSLTTETLDAPGVITAYKNLAYVERDFRTLKVDDLDLRPTYHYLTERVRSHVFLCMLAAYITWHLRKVLTPLTYTDEHIPKRTDPMSTTPTSSGCWNRPGWRAFRCAVTRA